MSFITRFSYGEITFQGIVNLKTCREIEIETERLDDMLVIRKKKNQRKGKKVLLKRNILDRKIMYKNLLSVCRTKKFSSQRLKEL